MHNLLPSSWLPAFMDEAPKVEEVRRDTARLYRLPKVRQKLGKKPGTYKFRTCDSHPLFQPQHHIFPHLNADLTRMWFKGKNSG